MMDLSEDCIITLLCILESKKVLEIQGSYPSSCLITNCGTEQKLFNSIPVVAAAAKLSKGKKIQPQLMLSLKIYIRTINCSIVAMTLKVVNVTLIGR